MLPDTTRISDPPGMLDFFFHISGSKLHFLTPSGSRTPSACWNFFSTFLDPRFTSWHHRDLRPPRHVRNFFSHFRIQDSLPDTGKISDPLGMFQFFLRTFGSKFQALTPPGSRTASTCHSFVRALFQFFFRVGFCTRFDKILGDGCCFLLW